MRGRHRVRPAGEAEFSDEAVGRADLVALRGRVRAAVDAAIGEDAADVTITLADGRTLHSFVAHAIGSLERPIERRGRSRASSTAWPIRCSAQIALYACAKLVSALPRAAHLQALFTAARAAESPC